MACFVSHTTVDCHDAYALSEWWRPVLGYVDLEGDPAVRAEALGQWEQLPAWLEVLEQRDASTVRRPTRARSPR